MEQCEKFYGPVYVELGSKVGEHVYQWEKDGISIDCVMLENKVVQIEYYAKFDKDQIESLLDKNAAERSGGTQLSMETMELLRGSNGTDTYTDDCR